MSFNALYINDAFGSTMQDGFVEKEKMVQKNVRFLLFVVVALASVFAVADTDSSSAARPNILWIVTEDIGCDMAWYGTKGVHTPNINQLAAEGALYTRAYTSASSSQYWSVH